MKNKTTIKDIAKMADVSVATVSYVLNDRKDQKISEATRTRIFQIVNLVGYTGSSAGFNPAAEPKNCIAIYDGSPALSLRSAERRPLTAALTQHFAERGYTTALLPTGKAEKLDFADAAVCVDTDTPFFRKLGAVNMIPLLAADMLVDDPIFYQLNYDYAAAYSAAAEHFGGDFNLLTYSAGNEPLAERIKDIFGGRVFFCDGLPDAAAYISARGSENTAVLGDFILGMAESSLASPFRLSRDFDAEAKAVFDCISDCLARTCGEDHDILTK